MMRVERDQTNYLDHFIKRREICIVKMWIEVLMKERARETEGEREREREKERERRWEEPTEMDAIQSVIHI